MPTDEPWFRLLSPSFDFSRPDAKAVHGFLKKSPDYSSTKLLRLYLSLDLDEYIEFNEDSDFLGSVPLDPTQQNPLAGTMVWLRNSATPRHVKSAPSEAQAEYLKGPIAKGHMGPTKFSPGMVSKTQPQTGLPCTQFTYCPPC